MARRGTWRAVALTMGLSAPLGADQLIAAPFSQAVAPTQVASPARQSGGEIQLKVRRQPDAVELVIEGTGAGPQLVQSTSPDGWMGQLVTSRPGALRVGPQRLTIPELGFQSVILDGAGSNYRLSVTPMQGLPLGRPVVSADGNNLVITFPASSQVSGSTARFDITQPGRIPGQALVPPLQPRAIAPPLGDMAVGTMVLRNRSYLNVSGPPVSMTIRNAPARDVLMTLSQMAGYGFVYVDDAPASGATAPAANPVASSSGRPVSISFQREPYARAFNAVLLAAGWQGRLEGRLIMAGPSVLGKSFGAQVSKIYRLNQASAASAADYLASLGASITKVNVITNSVTQGTSQASQVAGGSASQQTTTQNITTTETYGATTGPLRGLTGTTDSRLQTITLVGDSQLVAVAENYLRQIDLRQRQVALSVKILDVSLDNNMDIENSFAFRSGNSFILSQNGQLSAVFGSVTPSGQPNPGLAYPNNEFVDQLRALITSSSTKVLASPTLILSENADSIQSGADVLAVASNTQSGGSASIGRKYGNEGFITVGEQVITSFTTQSSTSGAPPVCTPVFGNAGLTFGARVGKIDDNGYVTFALSPEISAVVGTSQRVEGCGNIQTINKRRLDTGNLRVRDGQTLILTGVISDEARAAVRKWPIVGDIPLIGQFFRFSGNRRRKSELVILVTPRVVDDAEGGVYGYGYSPRDLEVRRGLGAASL